MKSSILDIVRETVYETLEDTLVDIVARAVAAEREACAETCVDIARQERERTRGRPTTGEFQIGAKFCADAIRARQ